MCKTSVVSQTGIGKAVTRSSPRILLCMSHSYICAQKDTQTCELPCAHKKRTLQANRFFGLVTTPERWEFCSLWRSYRVVAYVGMHAMVYEGGSDQMLYQHIPVLTPDITASCSSVPPSFLVFIVILVLFQAFLMVGGCCWFKYPKVHFSRPFKTWVSSHVLARARPVDFSTLTWQSWQVYLWKIWRFESVTQYTVKSNAIQA